MSSTISEDIGEEVIALAADGDAKALAAFIAETKLPAEQLVNWADDNGKTALHAAAANGHLECAKLLIAKGAKHKANSRLGRPGALCVRLLCACSGSLPLNWAVFRKEVAIVKLLLSVRGSTCASCLLIFHRRALTTLM